MKVALFVDSRSTGGIETHIAQLSRGLLAYNIPFEIVFYNLYQQNHPILALAKGNFSVINLGGSINNLNDYLKQSKDLILHTHGYKAGILGRLLGYVHGLPVVSTHHNGDPGKGKIFFYNLFDRLTSILSKNICVSQKIFDQLPINKKLIPNFIDFPKSQQTRGNRYQVAFVGRFSWEKGPDVFAEICADLPYSVAMYGDGEMLDEIKQKNPSFCFYGNVDMRKHWGKIRVLVISSRHEGLPMVALEAMAQGIPVVASRAGDLQPLIRNSGCGNTIDINKLSEFRQKTEYWMNLNNDEYHNRTTIGREYIYKNYSLKACIPEIIKTYQEACSINSIRQP